MDGELLLFLLAFVAMGGISVAVFFTALRKALHLPALDEAALRLGITRDIVRLHGTMEGYHVQRRPDDSSEVRRGNFGGNVELRVHLHRAPTALNLSYKVLGRPKQANLAVPLDETATETAWQTHFRVKGAQEEDVRAWLAEPRRLTLLTALDGKAHTLQLKNADLVVLLPAWSTRLEDIVAQLQWWVAVARELDEPASGALPEITFWIGLPRSRLRQRIARIIVGSILFVMFLIVSMCVLSMFFPQN